MLQPKACLERQQCGARELGSVELQAGEMRPSPTQHPHDVLIAKHFANATEVTFPPDVRLRHASTVESGANTKSTAACWQIEMLEDPAKLVGA